MADSTHYAPRMALAAMLALSLWSLETRAAPEEDAGHRAPARNVLVTGMSTSMAVDHDGSVSIWGTGRGSEKGTLPELEVIPATPARMEGLTGVVSLATSDDNGHALALLEHGTVLSWGLARGRHRVALGFQQPLSGGRGSHGGADAGRGALPRGESRGGLGLLARGA